MDKKRIVHVLDTPYSTPSWPHISDEDQDAILELLCRLLAPIGAHRAAHITLSKGRRSKKPGQQNVQDAASSGIPTPPEVAAFIDIGLASVTRNLQDHAGINSQPYSAVFVARSGQSSAFTCHFPQMVAVASSAAPSGTATRLVGFSKSCEERLSAALGIPRVSCVAVREGAPQAKGLIDYVREHVGVIDMAWLEQARAADFQDTKINAVPMKVGKAKKKALPSNEES